ncbi:MAG: tryptophan halogenase [Candidatus Angelobacter sp. Gp1-AA117]|nr:MAG: tryptophan halogenase [Candidatus Angelobacter sp. Gp1-AA117]
MAKNFKVVIVGGGTAGWMTAAYLSKALEQGVEICLVESSNINTIGVGEATFSTIHLFFDFLGLTEDDWMHECNGSYKVAIKFVNWNAEHRDFYHPFQRFDTVQGRSLAEWWLKCSDGRVPFDRACFVVPSICEAKRSPRYLNGQVFDNKADSYLTSPDPNRALLLDDLQIQYPYAYHFNASLLAKFMSRYAQNRGVDRIDDEVQEVHLSENGHIHSIDTKEHGRIEADLFIDCTGFRGLLINKALKEEFISFSDSLLCDSAVAMQVPRDGEAHGIQPYTTATTLSAGWVWNIPLYDRTGAGYVYSSAFLSSDEAEKEFRNHLGKDSDECKALHIKMRIGRQRNSWVKNCVAIGLSSGFVEPLESTGIFFIQHGIEQLVNHFPSKEFDEDNIKSYNQAVAGCIDGVREFLTIHYVASTREDTAFWRASKREIKIPRELAERLNLWKHCLPTDRTINQNYHGFESYSYSVMLLGLGHRPEYSLPLLNHMHDSKALAAFDMIGEQSLHLTSTLPSLYEYLSARYKLLRPRAESVLLAV